MTGTVVIPAPWPPSAGWHVPCSTRASMTASDQCRFLQAGPVFICAAFMGGLRTPRSVELERVCMTPDHSRCPYFLARMRREGAI